jgi:hypothetical protein
MGRSRENRGQSFGFETIWRQGFRRLTANGGSGARQVVLERVSKGESSVDSYSFNALLG